MTKRTPIRFICETTLLLLLAHTVSAQDATPLEKTRENLRLWLETMQKQQSEVTAWKNDQEVLANYKEALETEIAQYKEQIASAKTRAGAADLESQGKLKVRDQYATAEKLLAAELRVMEENFAKCIPLLPAPVTRFPKIAVGIETLKKNLTLPADQQTDDVAKRLANLTELMAEAEKFQQGVNVHNELHKKSDGNEYNMQVVYFGLAAAYAVNEDGSFALVGRPTNTGWKFTEQNELAATIKKLIVTATTDKDSTFTQLPLPTP
jgi:hypothetical protein